MESAIWFVALAVFWLGLTVMVGMLTMNKILARIACALEQEADGADDADQGAERKQPRRTLTVGIQRKA